MTRLHSALQLIDRCDTFADIGCDHAYLCLMVLQEKKADKVFACDISCGSLEKAKKLLAGWQNVEFILGDGFINIPTIVDTAAIMGMGGQQIAKILHGQKIQTLVLSPQNQQPLVRSQLLRGGYEIVDDFVVEHKARFYDIIKARYIAKSGSADEIMLEWGMFYKKRNETLKKKLQVYENKILGYKQTPLNIKKLQFIQEVKKWQQ